MWHLFLWGYELTWLIADLNGKKSINQLFLSYQMTAMVANPLNIATLITKSAFQNVHQMKIVNMDINAMRGIASNLVLIQANALQLIAIVTGWILSYLNSAQYIRVTQTIVVTSQTNKYLWATTFSHYLGQMHYRNEKKIVAYESPSQFPNFWGTSTWCTSKEHIFHREFRFRRKKYSFWLRAIARAVLGEALMSQESSF